MKRLTLILCLFISFTASAQLAFKSGSAQLDADLNNINARGSLNFTAFKKELSLEYGISNNKIDHMHVNLKMAPGEIYFALEISKYSRRPINEILEIYSIHKDKGWGFIAKQVGIKPGSEAFHQLKGNAHSKNNNGKGGKGNGKGKSNGKGKNK